MNLHLTGITTRVDQATITRTRHPMRVTFDRRANAAYIYLAPTEEDSPGVVARTETVSAAYIKGMVNLDFDKHGRLFGIEVLGATRLLPQQLLAGAERL